MRVTVSRPNLEVYLQIETNALRVYERCDFVIVAQIARFECRIHFSQPPSATVLVLSRSWA